MGELHAADLFAVDREVARGAAMLERWRRALARDPASAEHEEPLEPVRRVAGKTFWEELGALTPSAADVPLRDALREWVVALIQARVGRDEEAAWAVLVGDARGRFGGDVPRLVSFRQALRGLVGARTHAEARLWLEAAGDVGPALAQAAHARAEKRVEVARRLGIAHPWEAVVPATRAELRGAAEGLLAATEDLAREIVRPLVRDGLGPAGVMHAAVARDAGDGWPARLSARWLEETFATARGTLRAQLPPMPAALGATSFARAMYALGFALRGASVPKGTPFALGFDPGARASHRLGAVMAALAADADLQVRALGVGRESARRQTRVLARSWLLDLRLDAARLLLGDDAEPAPRALWDELGPRLYGAPLDARLRGAWPVARDDEPARFVARLEAHPVAAALRERFDADWYRNPKAWTHLRAVSSLASREKVTAGALAAATESLVRGLEGLLA